MTELAPQWTPEAIASALKEWLPDVEHTDLMRGTMALALNAPSTEQALDAWDVSRAGHAVLDAVTPETTDYWASLQVEPDRTPDERAEAMERARAAALALVRPA